MDGKRRGFISSTVGVGVFFTGATVSVNAAPIGAKDVLIAMPGERYYAVPQADLERFAVSPDTFQKEEAQRLAQASSNHAKSFDTKSGARRPQAPPPPPPPPPPPRHVAMGIRG